VKIRVISNLHTLGNTEGDDLTIDLYKYPKSRISLKLVLKIYFKSFKYDYLLLNGSSRTMMVLAFLKVIIPFNRCKLVSLDLVLRKPRFFRDRLLQLAEIVLYKKIHLYLEYFRNTSEYQRLFGMKPEKFRYIPFKVNSYEIIVNTKLSDEGYIFCGGRSLRDFATLIEATKDLQYPVKIVTGSNHELVRHDSCLLDEVTLPANVEVVRHDFDQVSFVRLIAASRLAVLPLKRATIAAAGISVYMMCMALKKCVIISDLPGVGDVLTGNQAIIVPPEDPEALREAIVKAYNDDVYRNEIAKNGYEYAIKLGGEKQLVDSVREVLVRDFVESRKRDN